MTDGTIDRTDEQVTFRYERHLNHPVDSVWHTLTDSAEIDQWMGTRPELDLRPGGHYITHHQGEHRVVDRILRVEPLQLFEHTFFAYANPGALVRWELSPATTGSLLVLTHVMSIDDVRTATETVAAGDDRITIFSRNAAGWHHMLDVIAAHLDGTTVTWSQEDQQGLQEHYASVLS